MCLFHKTEYPDVYDVYNKAKAKLGMADIPSLKISKMMRAVFKDATVAMYIPFACTFVPDKNKWLPLRIVSATT